MRAYADLLDKLLSPKADNFNNLIKSLADIIYLLIIIGNSSMDINVNSLSYKECIRSSLYNLLKLTMK